MFEGHLVIWLGDLIGSVKAMDRNATVILNPILILYPTVSCGTCDIAFGNDPVGQK